MRYRILLSVAVLIVLVALTGGVAGQTKKAKAKKRSTHRARQTGASQNVTIPTALPVPPQTEADGVRRITPQEARKAVESGRAIIVDVRGEESYKAGHARGARWIPLNDIGARSGELPRDKMIITYCS